MISLLYSDIMPTLPVSLSTPVLLKNSSSANVSLPPYHKGGCPWGSVSAPLNKWKPDAKLSQHLFSVKYCYHLKGQLATNCEVKHAITQNYINKKNVLDCYIKMASFLELPDEGKENVKKTFITQ